MSENPLAFFTGKKRRALYTYNNVRQQGSRRGGDTQDSDLFLPDSCGRLTGSYSQLLLNSFKETHSVHRDRKAWGQRLQASRAGHAIWFSLVQGWGKHRFFKEKLKHFERYA